ncbi:MAG: cupin domain-containing protein [Proteobacteria bacterium]|nr:cupin domain-containing protein [Pseudomonadota bacterium]
MQINADLSKRAVVNSNELPWLDSPLPGVKRRMLERDGEEVARATTIVRYVPDSYFDAHTHSGGEEFLVLDGIFSDEMGNFHQGMYVRNPIVSKHKPYTRGGTTILVKLQQFDPNDQEYVRIDTNKAEWLPGQVEGLRVMPLHEYGTEQVALVKWEPGTSYKRHIHVRGEEIYVISGVFADEHGIYPQGTWIRNPAGSEHTPYSDEGCVIYVKNGHL